MKNSKGCLTLLILGGIITGALILSETTPNTRPPLPEVPSDEEQLVLYRNRTAYRRDTLPRESSEKPKVLYEFHSRDYYHTSRSSGRVLYNNGKAIQTGLTDEEIVNQLSLDYQDLYDYYGGAEEIY